MAEKPNYYEVLGIQKTATVEEIKSAYKKIAMKNHPDMMRNKPEAEKLAATEKYKIATEAHNILIDAEKRSTYDKFGHNGLDNLKSTGSTPSGSSSGSMPVKKTAHSDVDTLSFFENLAEKRARETPPTTADGKPRKSAAEQAAENAEARRKAREAARGNPSPAATLTPPVAPTVTKTFTDVAEKVTDATDRLKEVTPSLEDLQKLRTSVQTLLNEVDAVISRSPKNNSPKL